jgi:hypothetical protein
MSREPEFIAKHKEALAQAYEACQALKMNAVDPAPRGWHYQRLVAANKELDGTCRQLFHWRGDDARWLKLGAIYTRASKVAARCLMLEKWAEFHQLAALYELGARRLMEMAERPTGRSIDKLVLPGDISPWFEASKVARPQTLN